MVNPAGNPVEHVLKQVLQDNVVRLGLVGYLPIYQLQSVGENIALC